MNSINYRSILYYGHDQKFYNDLRFLYDKFSGDFKPNVMYQETKKEKVDFSNFFINVIDYKARLIFIDLSDPITRPEMKKFIDILQTSVFTRKIPLCVIIGVVNDYEYVEELYLKGADLIYSKDMEIDIIAEDCFYFAFKEKVIFKDYAVARITKELEEYKYLDGQMLGKISYLSDKSIRVESNVEIPEAGLENFEFQFKSKAFTQLNMEINKVYERHDPIPTSSVEFAYSYYIPIPYTASDANQVNKVEVREFIDETRKVIPQNVVEILVIDAYFLLYSSASRVDKLLSPNFKINYLSTLSDDMIEIEHFRPNIILFQLTPESENEEEQLIAGEVVDGEAKATSPKDENEENTVFRSKCNDYRLLELMVKRICELKEYRPFIMVFKNTVGEASLNNMVSYSYMISTPNSIENFEVLDFVKKYSNSPKYTNNYIKKEIDLKRNVVFCHYNPKAVIHTSVPIDVIFVNECEVIFHTPVLFAENAIVFLPQPYEFYVTVKKIDRDIDGYVGKLIYKGIINAVSEEAKREVRILVNDIIFQPIKRFRELENKRAEEKKKEYQTKKTQTTAPIEAPKLKKKWVGSGQ